MSANKFLEVCEIFDKSKKYVVYVLRNPKIRVHFYSDWPNFGPVKVKFCRIFFRQVLPVHILTCKSHRKKLYQEKTQNQNNLNSRFRLF